jgi:hypothetical protein
LQARAINTTRARSGECGGMKIYRVTLTTGLQSLVKADRWLRKENTIEFRKGEMEVAKFYAASVAKIEDCTEGLPQKPEYLQSGLPGEMA